VRDLKAIIFDYYGTLVRLDDGQRERLFDEIASSMGVALAPGEAYRQWRERTTSDASLRLGGHVRPPFDGDGIPFMTFRDVWVHRSGELFALWQCEAEGHAGAAAYSDAHATAECFPDVPKAIEELRRECKVGVLSDADTDFLAASVALNKLPFETVVSSEDAGAYKPHISLFRMACDQLGVAPEEAAYVGDSPWADVAGARNAGMRAVWINRSGRAWPDDIEPPDVTVADLTDLMNAVRQ
jgi:2-haloalkanoic acid dehalogenase type II